MTALLRDIFRTPTREARMGFMDKAKKLAEQAQEKLDEAQKNFNEKQDTGSQPAQGGVRYDEHGRPIQDEAPAAATAPPPSATPPPAPPTQEQPATGGANATPDPFKPIDQ
jgi:hypothetical protein